MNDKHTDNKETKFVRGVVALAQELGIRPLDSISLFGAIARGLVQYGVKSGAGTIEALTKDTLERFATSLGGAVSDVTVTKKPGSKEVH